MRILLVTAGKTVEAGEGLTGDIYVHEHAKLAPLYLAASLKKAFGDKLQIKYVDLFRRNWEELDAILDRFSPDLVGISGSSCDSPTWHIAAKRIRARSSARLIAGGPYASSSISTALEDVELVAIGEGEETIIEIVQALLEGKNIFGIPGTAHLVNGNVQIANRRPPISDVDNIPFPDYSIIDNLDEYHTFSLFTSRGCPYQCTYCHKLFGKKIRFRSPDNVLDELEQVIERTGRHCFRVSDDCFNLDKERAIAICDGISRRNLLVRLMFTNGLRADVLDREVICALRDAGAVLMAFAVESASPRIQKLIKKRVKLEKVAENLEIAVDEGIVITTFNMLGFPTETFSEAWSTVQFNLDLPHHRAEFFMVTPQPGTPLFDLAISEGYKFAPVTYHSKEHSSSTKYISAAELFNLKSEAMKLFYLDDDRIDRCLRTLASFSTDDPVRPFVYGGLLNSYRNLPKYVEDLSKDQMEIINRLLQNAGVLQMGMRPS